MTTTTDTPEGEFESWGIVEVMGHRTFAGHIRSVQLAGSGMIRVDVPETEGCKAFTKLLSPGALYAITPTDEATARAVAASARELPVQTYQLSLSAPGPYPEDDAHLDDDPGF